jgi:DNA-binding NarL/FixJ family response regulator
VAIRVLLVEDNDVYRSSLELLLGLQPGLEVAGAIASGAEAADAARRLAPDVVVMDYRLPGLDGAAATRAVIAASGAAVVCLTAEATAEEREEILRAGAVGLVEKGGTVDGLADTIRAAAPG